MSEIHFNFIDDLRNQQLVEPNRRVIPKHGLEMGVSEYYLPGSQKRCVLLSGEYDQSLVHERLASIGSIPLLKALNINIGSDMKVLSVPDGTRSITSSLHPISRDLESYKPIFEQVGQIVGALAMNDLGLPSGKYGRGVFDSFAFVLDNDSEFGGRVMLTPPYVLSRASDQQDFLNGANRQMQQSRYFSKGQIAKVRAEISHGQRS